jgi:hypothetical protein
MAAIEGDRQWWEIYPPQPPPKTAAERHWLALRARAPMRQPAGNANRRRPRPEQNDVSGLALFEPPLV